jgi:hypothetical protein
MELKQVFTTPDGKMFETKKEALDYLRRPKIEEALLRLTKNNKDLVNWLIENQETVEMAFEVGQIRRVTKVEYKKLNKALDHLKTINDKDLVFLQENAAAILDSFRWPSVKRMNDDEKKTAARNTLMAASENNTDLSDWIIANKDEVMSAYSAGEVKRELNPKAAEGLAAYRAKMAAEKAAKTASTEITPA